MEAQENLPHNSIPQALAIGDRIKKVMNAQLFSLGTEQKKPDYFEKLDATEGFDSTRAVRSETLATQDQIHELIFDADQLRNLVFEKGVSWLENSGSDYDIKTGVRTLEECKARFWKSFGNSEVFADMARPQDPEKLEDFDMLLLMQEGKDYNLVSRFDFDGNFDLRLDFHSAEDPKRPWAVYYPGKLSLYQMTEEEYQIIAHCQKKFIQLFEKPGQEPI